MSDWREQLRNYDEAGNELHALHRARERAGLPGAPPPPFVPPGGPQNQNTEMQWPDPLSAGDVNRNFAMNEGLPMLGSAVLGAAGAMTGPAAPVLEPLGQGIGGAMGHGAAMMMQGQPLDWRQLGMDAAFGTALGGAGRLAAAGTGALGTQLYKTGLRAPQSDFAKFPDMARYGAEHGMLFGPQVGARLGEVTDDVTAALQRAEAAGLHGNIDDLLGPGLDTADRMFAARGMQMGQGEADRITQRAYDEFRGAMQRRGMGETPIPSARVPAQPAPPLAATSTMPGAQLVPAAGGQPARRMTADELRQIQFNPMEIHLGKQALQEEPASRAAFNALRTRGRGMTIRPEYSERLQQGAGQFLRSNVKGYGKLMKESANLKGLKTAFGRSAESSGAPSFLQLTAALMGMHHGGPLEAALAGEAASPIALRAGGIAMNSAPLRLMLRYGPQLGRYAHEGYKEGLLDGLMHGMQSDSLNTPAASWADTLAREGGQ